MALKEFTFSIGETTQTVKLPEEHISDVMEGKHVPAVDVKQATIDCMRHPIGSAPLREKVQPGDKVCLVVADITRTWNRSNQFLIYVVDELNLAGIPDDDIYIVFSQAPTGPRRRKKTSPSAVRTSSTASRPISTTAWIRPSSTAAQPSWAHR